MPLSFQSKNHGDIAFGFFNIESDMLLLENYFFFADQFCSWMEAFSKDVSPRNKPYEKQIFIIPDRNNIGDLMGAIHGIQFTGFIGEVYKHYPFPADPAAFKQNPTGDKTQGTVKNLIEPFAEKQVIQLSFDDQTGVRFGAYLFEKVVFYDMLNYVWLGGYPRWKDGQPPSYVVQMKKQLQNSHNVFFKAAF